jgi:hypothetical protein
LPKKYPSNLNPMLGIASNIPVKALALGSVAILAYRLCIFGVATVNRNFWPKLKSVLGAFPANPSNPALNPTAPTGIGLAPRWASV